MKYSVFFLCSFFTISALAVIPPPTLYYPLENSPESVAWPMPVTGSATYSAGMAGFGQCVSSPGSTLRAPLGYNYGAEPGTSNWTLSFWTKFDWKNTVISGRLFSKGGRSDNANEAPGLQLYIRSNKTATLFFSQRSAIERD